MLVFLSDLHITNKTTGVQHLSIGAFSEALTNLSRQAHEAKSTEITLVFLGDIFDLVRTTFWLDKPLEERPWGLCNPPRAAELATVEEHALELLNDTIGQSADIFELLAGPLKERFELPVEPRRVYVPGNHDRICNQFPRLRARVIEVLGLNTGLDRPLDPEQPFTPYFHSPEYMTFARHGHEWDDLNFEHTERWKAPDYIVPSWEEYMEVPIGEVIAGELASRMALEVGKRLPVEIPAADRDQIVERMKTIDDLRPALAFVPWLVSSLDSEEILRRHKAAAIQAISEAIQDIVDYVDKLPFTQRWMREHDTVIPWDSADRLQWTFLALRQWDILKVEKLLRAMASRTARLVNATFRLVPAIDTALTEDNYAGVALADVQRVQADPRFADKVLFVLYGHTHQAEQVPLSAGPRGDCQVYLNTGTWRPLYRQTVAQNGFMRWKNLTFTIFYCAAHDSGNIEPGKSPTFETWTGSLLDPI